MKKFCENCGKELPEGADVCLNCGKKLNTKKSNKKKFPAWAIVLCVIAGIVVIGAIASIGNEDNNSNEIYKQNNKNKVTVIDFSNMTKAEIDTWCENSKINCTIESKYSDIIEKDGFVSQSIISEKTIYEGDKITIIFSLGKEPSMEYKNALKKAESYAKNLHMSKQAIYDQLISQYGEGFPKDAAQYAIDNLQVDWNANALEKAKSYQKNLNMSKNKIYEQLISQYGEKFTTDEAQYAINHLED